MKVYNIFPLTICQSKIDMEDKEKSNLISLIKEMKASSKNIDYYNKIGSWTGDTQGFENLHHNSEFNNLFGEIKKKLIEYLDVLNIDQEQLDELKEISDELSTYVNTRSFTNDDDLKFFKENIKKED